MLVPRPTWLRPSGSVYWSPESAPERTAASYAHDPRARQQTIKWPASVSSPAFRLCLGAAFEQLRSFRVPVFRILYGCPNPPPFHGASWPAPSSVPLCPVPCTLISHAALAKALDLFREFCVPRISTSVSARWPASHAVACSRCGADSASCHPAAGHTRPPAGICSTTHLRAGRSTGR